MISFDCQSSNCPGKTVFLQAGTLKCTECELAASTLDVFRAYAKRTGQWIIGGGTFTAVGYLRTNGTLGFILTTLGVLGLGYAFYRVLQQQKWMALLAKSNAGEDR